MAMPKSIELTPTELRIIDAALKLYVTAYAVVAEECGVGIVANDVQIKIASLGHSFVTIRVDASLVED